MTTTEKLISALGAEDLRDTLKDNPDGYQFKKRTVDQIEGMCFHQSLGWSTLENIHRYHTGPNHMAQNGLQRITYTLGIRRDGRIAVLNDLETRVWSQGDKHTPGDENAKYLSCVFEGLFKWVDNGKMMTEYLGQNAGEPSVQQLQSFLFVWDTVAKEFGFGIKDIYGHFDFGKPSCPGYTLETMIKVIRNQFDFSNVEERERFLREFGFEKHKGHNDNVKEFQSASGITSDGIWGPNTAKTAYRWVQHRGKV